MWSDIFSPDGTANKLVKLADNLKLTSQEKMEAFSTNLTRYEPFKLVQRLIVIQFAILFSVSFFIAVIYYNFAAKETLDGYLEVVTTFRIPEIMFLIVGFYFLGGVVPKGNKP